MRGNNESPLAKWRKNLGLNQRELAHAAGCSAGHISDVEHGLAHLGENLEKYLRDIADNVMQVVNGHEEYMNSIRKQLQSKV